MDEVDAIVDALCEFWPYSSVPSGGERRTCSCRANSVPVSRGEFAACASCGKIVDELCPHHHTAKPDADVHARCGQEVSPLYPMSSLGGCSSARKVRSGIHHRDRAVYVASTKMRERVCRGQVSASIVRVAENMYRRVADAPSMANASRDGIVEGALYAASRACGVPKTPDEIARMFDVPTRVVRRGAQKVADVLASSKGNGPREPEPLAFVARYIANAPGHRRCSHTGALAELVRSYVLEMFAMSKCRDDCRDDCRHLGDGGIDVEDVAPQVVTAVAFALAWEHTGRRGGVGSASAASGIAQRTVRSYVTKFVPSARRARLVERVSIRIMNAGESRIGTIHAWTVRAE